MNYGKLHEIMYCHVKPTGWLREVLVSEKNGMPGHLNELGYPFDTECWKYKSMTELNDVFEWWPYEQCAYWIDSMVRTAGLLEDQTVYKKVELQINALLNSGDDFIGPIELQKQKRCFRWPLAVLSRALYARWSFTGDEQYLEKLRRHYLDDSSDYSGYRDIVNIETMLRLYEYFKDERLLKKAVNAYELFDQSEEKYSSASAMKSDVIPYQHCVTYNEHAKLAAIMYLYTGNRKYLEAAEKGYEKLQQYFMLVDGIPCSCEFTEGNETKWAHESCMISDYTWSLGFLLEATGSSKYADRIERAVLNAAFGAIGPQFRTIQYFSTVNQVVAARNSTSLNIKDFTDTPRMAFQPHHYPECCCGNIGRVFPNYVLRMYQTTDEGVCISLYGDSVYDGNDMKLVQTGGYPFGDSVRIQAFLKNTDKNQLKMRIPYWAKHFSVKQNNNTVHVNVVDGYFTISVADEDEIILDLKKEFSSHESPDGGIYFEYGPFLLAQKMEEQWEIDLLETKQTKDFPAYNVYASSPWHYCVSGKEVPDIHSKEICANPFWEDAPFEIIIHARVLNHWELVRTQSDNSTKRLTKQVDKWNEMAVMKLDEQYNDKDVLREHLTTPELPDSEFVECNKGDLKKITLVPYGCTNLRITVFPKYNE